MHSIEVDSCPRLSEDLFGKYDLFLAEREVTLAGERNKRLLEGQAVTHSDYRLIFVDFLSLALTGVPTPPRPLSGLLFDHGTYCMCGISHAPCEEKDWAVISGSSGSEMVLVPSTSFIPNIDQMSDRVCI